MYQRKLVRLGQKGLTVARVKKTETNMKKIIKETMIEQKRDERSREIREENTIIHRVKESNDENPAQGKQHDLDFFHTLCTEELGL